MKAFECGKRKSPFPYFHPFLMENIIISYGKYSWEKLYFSSSTYAWSRKGRLKELSKVSMLTAEWKIETHFIWLFLFLVLFLLSLSKMSPDVKCRTWEKWKTILQKTGIVFPGFEPSWECKWRFHQNNFLNSQWHFAVSKLPQQIHVNFCPWQIKLFYFLLPAKLFSHISIAYYRPHNFLHVWSHSGTKFPCMCTSSIFLYLSPAYQIRKPNYCFFPCFFLLTLQ